MLREGMGKKVGLVMPGFLIGGKRSIPQSTFSRYYFIPVKNYSIKNALSLYINF